METKKRIEKKYDQIYNAGKWIIASGLLTAALALPSGQELTKKVGDFVQKNVVEHNINDEDLTYIPLSSGAGLMSLGIMTGLVADVRKNYKLNELDKQVDDSQ